MRSFLGVLCVGLLVFASSVASAQDGSVACDFAARKFCVESATVDIESDCATDGGEMIDVCPTQNRIGTCVTRRDGGVVTSRYYLGFPIDPSKMCRASGGAYTPN